MKIKETITSLKEKLQKAGVKKLLASRAFLVSGCVVLIVAAVTVSALIGKPADQNGIENGESESGKLLGNSVLVGDTVSGVGELSQNAEDAGTEEQNDLLAVTVLNRTAVRENAMEVLQKIADNPDALPDEKEEALAQIADIMDDMTAEANIETLAAAKGIPECVAVISGDKCSVIVDTAEISEEQLSQITEIVYEQSGILPAGTNVILAIEPESAEESA